MTYTSRPTNETVDLWQGKKINKLVYIVLFRRKIYCRVLF